jgi:hypothetical protein
MSENKLRQEFTKFNRPLMLSGVSFRTKQSILLCEEILHEDIWQAGNKLHGIMKT